MPEPRMAFAHMKKPAFPENELERQRAVEKYQLLDTHEEESYDAITALIAYICEVPISLVSLLDRDRNFLKSHNGVPFSEDPRDRSFCGHAILQDDDFMIVPDATKDDRFHDNPLVTELGVRFYAGAALINPEGHRLGTLCVFDMEPKELNDDQVLALINLSRQVMLVMENHYKQINLRKAQEELKQRNRDLEKFAAKVSHDLKSPLSRITGLANILEHTLDGKIDQETANCIHLIKQSSDSLASYIQGILKFYNSEELLNDKNQQTDVKLLFSELKAVFATEQDVGIQFESSVDLIRVNNGALMQILLNLVTNGIKYNSNDNRFINIKLSENDGNYHFEISDNGDGIAEEERERVFELFETGNKKDRYGHKGTGIGLPTVNKLIESLQGTIRIDSVVDQGTTVYFTLPKN